MSLTPKEGVFYAGVMVGILAGSLGAQALHIHHLIGLGVGVLGGAGLGYAMQQIFFPRQPNDTDDPR